jgi:hypothetical protein
MNEIQRQAKEKAQEGLDSQLDYLYQIQTPFTRDKETLQGIQNTVYAKANEFADGKYSVNEMHQQQRALKHQIMTSKDINKIVSNASKGMMLK